jgi:two-component system, NtrC family, nitrogen regulation sensor histidine kinase NtrY
MADSRKKGSRVIGAIIILLIVLFFAVEVFIRESQEFSPTRLTNVLLSSLQIIVLLLGLILFFVLGRNLVKLYLERKRKVVGSHFKTKLVTFFIALSFIPTLLLFFFASDFVSRNIEQWFQTPLDNLLEDTKSVADSYTQSTEELAYHDAQQLSRAIIAGHLINAENRPALRDFIRAKLTEYKLDEIGIFLDEEELFSYINPALPLQDYRDLKSNIIKRAQLGEDFKSVEPMGSGQMIRRGVAFSIPGAGNVLVTTGKFLPQNDAQKISNIAAYVQRYRLLKTQKNPVKSFYVMTLVFITILIIFAATWIGFHLAKSINVPIEKLAQATKEVSRGNLDVRVEDPASDEIGTLIDSFNQMISDLKNSQAAVAQKTSELESRKSYTETILDNITTGVIALDARAVVTTINPSAREMLGLPSEPLIGKSVRDILGPPRYAEVLKNIEWGVKNRHKLADKEIAIASDGQETHLALALSPLKKTDGDFSGLIIVLDDLTQLIKAQKIAAWKEVAQRVAHEIKNPLTPIQLSAERIIKNLERSEPGHQAVVAEGARTIIREAGTIKALVDEFSNFARMPKVQLRAADIRQIIDQTVALFKGIFAEIMFEVECAPDVPPLIQADPDQMKRAIINIIDNAIDAMNKKGKIVLRASFDKEIRQVRLDITDSGPGIKPEDQLKLFQPHYSTKKKGAGLGLAIVNQIIRDHNGTVSIENAKPNGARFTIQIPA